ncbi:MAG TPA: hypothetical protein VHY34_07820 [Caulobacteraceae bacterium]|nr:hypothetical protein [Caulobacteraceae bacterium]
MFARISRVLIGLAALGLAVDAALHWILFGQSALAVISGSNLPATLTADFKVLWIADVSTLLSLAAVFGWAAVSPSAASGPVIIVLSIIPAALGVLIFAFGAPSYAGFNMLAAAVIAAIGGLLKALGQGRTAQATVAP